MLNGKKALVTGSSRGIGAAVAKRLARDGFEVTVCYAGNAEKAQAVADEIIKDGGKAQLLGGNLCDLDDTKKLCDEIGDIDVLVLNASVQIRKKWYDISIDEAQNQLNCNFISSLMLIKAAVPHMKAQKWGRIVTVGSVQ